MNRITEAISGLQKTAEQLETEVRVIPADWLSRKPGPDVWSIFDNLGHIHEFVPYWTRQIESIKVDSTKEWGRTHADADRLAAVANTAGTDLDTILFEIRARIHAACGVLSRLHDEDLKIEAPSRNPRWGVKPAGFVLDTLLVKHLEGHRQQIERNVKEFTQMSSTNG